MEELISKIKFAHRSRLLAMELRKRQDQRIGAFIRDILFTEADGDKDARQKKADAVVAAVEEAWQKALTECADAAYAKEKEAGAKATRTRRFDLREEAHIQDAAMILVQSAELPDIEPRLVDHAKWVVLPGIRARRPNDKMEQFFQKQCEAFAAELPVAQWWQDNVQNSFTTLASIVGTAGNLSDYATDDKFIARMGLAPKGGVMGSTRKVSQWCPEKTTKQDWTDIRYPAKVRTLLYQWSDSTIKTRGKMRSVYDYHKARMLEKNETGGYAEKAALLVAWAERDGKKPHPTNVDGKLTPIHIDKMARVKMEQRMLRGLWAAWNGR